MRFRIGWVVFAPLVFLVSLTLCSSGSRGQQPQQPAAPPSPPPAPAVSQNAPPIRQNVNLVNVLFSVFDRQENLETALARQDFQVFDDNQRQEIRFFSRQSDLPLRVGLLLDTSNSIRERLPFEQDAAVDFLYKVIRKERDQAFLMSVDGKPELLQGFTPDVERLKDVIMKQRVGGGTALYDAIYAACEEVLRAPAARGSEMRRVLVVISDGADNLSRHTMNEALDMAERADILVYTISSSTSALITDEEAPGIKAVERKYRKEGGDLVLQRFADDSGGRVFFPFHAEDLAVSFLQIGNELRSQYSLGYVLPRGAPDGKFHTIRITVNDKKMRVRTRRGYYATAPAVSQSDGSAAPDAGPAFPSK